MTDSDWREAFRQRIAAAGYSPRSLSLAAGLNPTAIRDILQGRSRRPRYQTLYRIAQVLGTTPEALLAEDDAPETGLTGAVNENVVALSPGVPTTPNARPSQLRSVPLLNSDAIRQTAPEASWVQGEMGLLRSFLDT